MSDGFILEDPDRKGGLPRDILEERDKRLRQVYKYFKIRQFHRRFFGKINSIEKTTRPRTVTKDWVIGVVIYHTYDSPVPNFIRQLDEEYSIAIDFRLTEEGTWKVHIL